MMYVMKYYKLLKYYKWPYQAPNYLYYVVMLYPNIALFEEISKDTALPSANRGIA